MLRPQLTEYPRSFPTGTEGAIYTACLHMPLLRRQLFPKNKTKTASLQVMDTHTGITRAQRALECTE